MKRAIVIAYEGHIQSPFGDRIDAMADAMQAFDIAVDEHLLAAHTYGRTFRELAQHLLEHHPRIETDPTLLELLALEAEQRLRLRRRDTPGINPQSRALLEAHASRGTRVIVRSDAPRREVDDALRLAGVESLIAMIRAVDDPPSAGTHHTSTMARSWEAIVERLDRWGTPRDACEIAEASQEVRAMALMMLRSR